MKINKIKYVVGYSFLGLALWGVFGCNAGNSNGSNITPIQASSAQNGGSIDSVAAISSSAVGKFEYDTKSGFLYVWVGYDGKLHRIRLHHYGDHSELVHAEPLTPINLKMIAQNVDVLNRVIYVMPSTKSGGSNYGRYIVIGDHGTLLMSTDNSASTFEKINIPGDSSDLNLTHVVAHFDANNNLVIVVTGLRYDENGNINNEIYYLINTANGTFPQTPSSLSMKKLGIDVQNSIYNSIVFVGDNIFLTDGTSLISFTENTTTEEFDDGEVKYKFPNGNQDPVEKILVPNPNVRYILVVHKSGSVGLYKNGAITSTTYLPTSYHSYGPGLGGVNNAATVCSNSKVIGCFIVTLNFYQDGDEIGGPVLAMQEIQVDGSDKITSYMLPNTAEILDGVVISAAIYQGDDGNTNYPLTVVNQGGGLYASMEDSFPGKKLGQQIYLESLLGLVQ